MSDNQIHTSEHTHGAIVDAGIVTTDRGLWAVKWSFIGLFITALFQLVIVFFSGSVALLADTIHNFADASTAIPLGIAFILAKRKATRKYMYGMGKVEDVAGVLIVLIMFASALAVFYESINRFLHPQPVEFLGVVAIASVIGFLGNEAVAWFRIKVGKDINSAALVADGYHARADGITSLAVLGSVIGIWLGFPLADPLIGIFITFAILKIVWESGKNVFTRLLNGVENPQIVEEVKHAVEHVDGVEDVTETRIRWIGHKLHAEVNIAVSPILSITEAHDIASEVRHQLLHRLKYLSNAIIHVDPSHASGEQHHRITQHVHDNYLVHSH